MNKRILYVEISSAHTEIMASFVESLRTKFDLAIAINQKSYERLAFLGDRVRLIKINEDSYLKDILKIKKEFSPDFILLNSSQGRKIRDLCLRLLFDPTPVIGIHHNAENIYKSFTQKIIHFKIKKYIVLADFIKDHVLERIKSTSIQIESFYPLIYPQTKAHHGADGPIYIAVPGVLEQDRRDYFGLVEMVRKHDQSFDPKLKFVLLGNSKNHDGPHIVDLINKYDLQNRFILFSDYVLDNVMVDFIQKSVAVMPLLHPGTRWFEKYFETKISGAYNLAYAFDKILLMHEIFEGKDEFKQHAVFYSTETFNKALIEIQNFKRIEKLEKFQLKIQTDKLIHFIQS